MAKPRIGLTARHYKNERGGDGYLLNDEYTAAIWKAGGIPTILPWVKDQLEATSALKDVKGVLFTGGEDLWPFYYGAKLGQYTRPASLLKCQSDMSYMWSVLRQNVPTLAICLGFQEMNVALGGTLKQHVTGHVKEWHKVKMMGPLKKIFGKKAWTNSWHHQAVDALGRELCVTALAKGLIEGFCLPKHRFALGVQWHPESIPNTRHDRLFDLLVEESSR